jgi:mxaD protein
MKTMTTMTLALAVLASGYGMAAIPQLHVRKTIVIDAPADKVWAAVKDFDHLNGWHPAVAKDTIVEGKNNMAGAVRELTLQDGGTIKEKLLSFDAAGHRFKYSIIEGVLPVSSYVSWVAVKSMGPDKTLVSWSGSFKRKDLGAHPADNANDKTATGTISGVYQAGLDNLKKQLEAKSP